MKNIKLALLVAFLLALAFIFSCSSDNGDGDKSSSSVASGDQEKSSSSSLGLSSSDGTSSSSSDDLSSSSETVLSSSSVGISSSSVVLSSKGNDIANYKTKIIGNQVWMAENLNYDVAGSKCYGEDGKEYVSYDEETDIVVFKELSNAEIQANCDKYGRLYDWATAMALPSDCNSRSTSCASQISEKHKGICPSGWHIPSEAEWSTLINYVESISGCNHCAGKLLTVGVWNIDDVWNSVFGDDYNGTDDFGFAALPGGFRQGDGGYFYNAVGVWWSSTEEEHYSGRGYGALSTYLYYSVNYSKNFLLSVRCVHD
jgi:uncharacterized protein (TIGR02145 family)